MSATKHRRLAQYLEGKDAQRYRELMISNLKPGIQNLSLILNDSQFDEEAEEDKEYIVIPLGRTKTVPGDSPLPTKPEEYANYTVPIIPKRYATSAMDKAQGDELRAGWLYIYRNGYLWRELQALPSGFLKDVNLRRYQGQNLRPATGEADSRVIVPWKIDNKRQTIEIAYSEVQWSWPRINAMGGMDPDKTNEPRLKSGTPMPNFSPEETQKNRKGRMQDITHELEEWILTERDTPNIQSAEKVTANIYSLQLHKYSKMPVVFLQDPLGIALDNAKAYQESQKKLTDLMVVISKKPFYKSAVLTYKLFFDPKNASKPVKQHVTYWGGTTYGPTTEKTIFGKCGDKTDKEKLEILLEVNKRKKLRADIREIKESHVDFLQGKHNGASITRSDFIAVNIAMVDFFSLEGYEYTQSWQAMLGLIAGLNNDPCSIDSALTLPADRDRVGYKNDPGCQYMEALLKPDHPLHAKLFPTEQQSPVESDAQARNKDPENDGLGDFRAATFAAAIAGTLRTPTVISQETRRLSQFANQCVGDLMHHFAKQYKKGLESPVAFDFKALTRLGKLTSDDLKGMRVFANINSVPKDYRIVEAGISKIRTLKAFEIGKKALNKARKSPNSFKILDAANELIATDNLSNLAKFKGVSTTSGWSLSDIKKMQSGDLKLSQGTKVYRQSAHIIAVPETSPLATKLADIDAKVAKNIEIQASALRALRKTLPPVVVAFELWNLHSVVVGTKVSEGRKQAEFASAVFDLAYATLEGITQVLGDKQGLGKTIAKAGYKTAKGRQITFLPVLGAVASFGSFAVSLMDMLDELGENDEDAAVGHGIAAAGFGLMGLALLGAGTEIAAFAVFVPYLWVAVGVVLIGVIIANACDNSPLEDWAANGPFSIEEGDEKFSHLRDAKNDHLAYNALANCLFTPRIEIERLSTPVFNESQPGDIRVTVHLPNFTVGQDEIDVRTYASERMMMQSTLHLNPNTQVTHWMPPKTQSPFIIKQLKTGQQVTAMEYYYHSTAHDYWHAKGRIFLAQGPTILPEPAPPQGTKTKRKNLEKPIKKPWEADADFLKRYETYEKEQAKLDILFDKDIPGWVYAKLD